MTKSSEFLTDDNYIQITNYLPTYLHYEPEKRKGINTEYFTTL